MFINRSKEDRARRVVTTPNQFDAESVERKALELGKAEKLEGEDLVLFVYRKIGGAVAGEPVKKDTREGEIDVKTEGNEVEEVGKPQRRKKAE